MIGYMGAQQRKQLEGLEELSIFTSREVQTFKTSLLPYLVKEVHQTIAKAALALDWLSLDVPFFEGTSNHNQIVQLLASVEQNRSKVMIA